MCYTNKAAIGHTHDDRYYTKDLLSTWKVQAPQNGSCALNTTAWLNTGSTVDWFAANGLCFLHYVLNVKTACDGGEIATGMPEPISFIHELAPNWGNTSGAQCSLMIDGRRMTGNLRIGTYAGTLCYVVK